MIVTNFSIICFFCAIFKVIEIGGTMADILDYIKWRGDLTFSQSPLNCIDALVFCQMSYNHLHGIVSQGFDNDTRKTLGQVLEEFKKSPTIKRRSNVGAMINPKTLELLYAAGESERFRNILVGGYISRLDLENEEQFACLTFSCPEEKWNFISYRGTDDNLVGWKEDFNLAVKECVPAQKDGLLYFQEACRNLSGQFYLGGHSKGGNLALYSSVNCDSESRARICGIFNFDGPGFGESFFRRREFLEIQGRFHSFYPHNSVIGMLFFHSQNWTAISTDAKPVWSHDPFTWHVEGPGFVTIGDTDRKSKLLYKTVNQWICDLSMEQKVTFINTIFDILAKSQAKTSTELKEKPLESMFRMMAASAKLDRETSKAVQNTLGLLVKYVLKNRKG